MAAAATDKMDGSESTDFNGEYLMCPFPGCSKSFQSRWSMTRHIRTHTGEKPFRCSFPGCSKDFVQKCSLKRHEQTHSDAKHFVCDDCGKRFKLKEYLDVHRRTHAANAKSDQSNGAAISESEDEDEDEDESSEEMENDREDNILLQHSDPSNAAIAENMHGEIKDAAASLIDQLRQRLVRMSVRYHEQLFSRQQKEETLQSSLAECSAALAEAVKLLNRNESELPDIIVHATNKYCRVTSVPSASPIPTMAMLSVATMMIDNSSIENDGSSVVSEMES